MAQKDYYFPAAFGLYHAIVMEHVEAGWANPKTKGAKTYLTREAKKGVYGNLKRPGKNNFLEELECQEGNWLDESWTLRWHHSMIPKLQNSGWLFATKRHLVHVLYHGPTSAPLPRWRQCLLARPSLVVDSFSSFVFDISVIFSELSTGPFP